MHPILIGCGGVPRSLISKRVKIPPVLFTRIGAEANSGRVSLDAGDDPPATWGSSMPLWAGIPYENAARNGFAIEGQYV
jgi:hypothetical protein